MQGDSKRQDDGRYRALFETAPLAIFVSDGQRLVEANAACVALFGARDKAELVGRDPLTLVHPDALPLVRERLHALLVERRTPPPAEVRFLRCSGGSVDVEVTSTTFEEDGRVHIHVMLVDITERKRREQREFEGGLRRDRLLQQLDEVVWAAEIGTPDRAGSVDVAGSFERIFGAGVEAFAGSLQRWLDAIHPSDVQRAAELVDATMAAGRAVAEYRIVRPDGEVRWVRDTRVALSDGEGRPTHIGGVLRDLTDQRAAELASAAREATEAASRAKSAFLSNMSHEIRTPIGAIVGFAQLLMRLPGLPDGALESVRDIRRAADHLLLLVDDVLEMARLEAGRVVLAPHPFSVSEVLVDLGRIFRLRAAGRGLLLQVEPAPPGCDRWMADQAKIRHILGNLLGNALKFTERGSVALRVRWAEAAGPESERPVLVFEVEDTGPGIAPDDRERLFRRFEHGEARPTGARGVGLGLTIAREYAELLGGRIELEGGLGRGSLFRLSVPVERCPDAAPDRPRSTARPMPGSRVLVVDDNDAGRRAAAGLLNAAGLICEAVGDGQAALEVFRAWRPHVVLMDLVMPGMGGLEAIARLRALPGGRDVRIVSVTASPYDADRSAAFAAGADRHLTRPYLAEQLLQAVGVNDPPYELPDESQGGRTTAQQAAPSASPAAAAVSEPHPPADILVIDDAPTNVAVICAMLKQWGHAPRAELSGTAGLAAAFTKTPDLILLDVGMPDLDGFEVCARLKAERSLAGVPVIFVSAWTEAAQKVRAFAVGGADYITKPFSFEEVGARVASQLLLARQRAALEASREQVALAERMRDGLVHMLIHDLRSPLSALCANLETIEGVAEDEHLSPQSREDLAEAQLAGRRLADMIGCILDVSRLEAGRLVPRRARVDVHALLVSEMRAQARQLARRRVSLAPGATSLQAEADEDLLRRVVQNLLQNAAKFTPEGGRIELSATATEAIVRVEIRDTGPGIAPEFVDRIFDKFTQVEARIAGRAVPSTGLGLTFSKLAIEALGGHIGVETKLGEGSLFWFTLPRADAQAPR